MIISYICTILVLVMSFFWPVESVLKQETNSLTTLLETPNWSSDENMLYMIDIPGFTVYQYNPANGQLVPQKLPRGPCGLVMPLANAPPGYLLVGIQSCLYVFNFYNATELRFILCVDAGKPDNSIHEAKCDPKNRLWFGTLGKLVDGNAPPNQGKLYMVTNTTYQCPKVEKCPVTLSDGITWSPDFKTMYYNDQPTRKTITWDYNLKTGGIANQRVFFDFVKRNVSGAPNGMTVDNKGNIWLATNRGAEVLQLNGRTGNILQVIEVPNVDQVTSIVFGGPNFCTLFITTAGVGVATPKPGSGSLYSWTDGKTCGLAPNDFEICDVKNY